jgi:hypothetical protein
MIFNTLIFISYIPWINKIIGLNHRKGSGSPILKLVRNFLQVFFNKRSHGATVAGVTFLVLIPVSKGGCF